MSIQTREIITMSKNAKLPTADSGHANAPDFPIPDAAARHNLAATEPHRKAAKRNTVQPRAACPPRPSGASAKP